MHKARGIIFRILHKLHLWVALVLFMPLVLIGLTGSLMVYQEQIKNLISEPPKLTEGKVHSAGEIITAAAKDMPDNLKVTMYRASNGKQPALVRFSSGERKSGPGGGKQVLIDPVSLKIFKNQPGNDFFRQVQSLHSSLLLRDYNGRTIVGWLGVCMLLLGISGLVMWWPKAKRLKAALTIKKGARGLRLHRDIHGATGIWGYVIFILVSFSGVYLAFPQSVGGIFSQRDLRGNINIEKVSDTRPIDIDKAIATAEASVPESDLLSVIFPQKSDQPYRISLAPKDYTEGRPAVMVFVDQYKNTIAEIRDPKNYSGGENFVAWQRVIHSGQGGGIIWKLFVFITGFSPLLFTVTGISMWLIKRRAKRD